MNEQHVRIPRQNVRDFLFLSSHRGPLESQLKNNNDVPPLMGLLREYLYGHPDPHCRNTLKLAIIRSPPIIIPNVWLGLRRKYPAEERIKSTIQFLILISSYIIFHSISPILSKYP